MILSIPVNSKNYPQNLKNIFDPPAQLFVIGHWPLVNKAVAVVGTRQPTSSKVLVTRELVARLTEQNYTIVSGMAIGIDASAHWAAINNGGKTIAVLGCGVDIIYPPQNRKLYYKIIETGGAIVSEIPPGELSSHSYFPARNRIIAGLSELVIVIEAQLKSGALITARIALEQGKDVFVVPGSPGCDYLLDNGAGILSETNL